MRAMILRRLVSLDDVESPLELADVPTPSPRAGELLIRVAACGVCHTELDEIEGRTAPPRARVRPTSRPGQAPESSRGRFHQACKRCLYRINYAGRENSLKTRG
jgi:threonine dehydrogenase-like Zn-dependent dehydrogenase